MIMRAMSKFEQTRINNRLPVAREGLPFIFISGLLALLFLFVGLRFLAVFTGFLSLFTIYFFRDPERNSSAGWNAVLTPADGRILDIRYVEDGNNPLGAPAVRVSIFMSIFSVHVNRIPISGIISKISYYPGGFFSANLDKASHQNENNRLTLKTRDERKIIFVQIAGLIARRIVCWIKEGDEVQAGQRFGLIRFGSRLDVYLPHDSLIIAQPRNRVRAGETILGYLT
jgi:phosphatidylserine decarboxylase